MKGTIEHEKGNILKAIDFYKEALRNKFINSSVYGNLANALRKINARDDAECLLEFVISNDPKNAIAHFNMGNIVFERGQFKQAKRYYEKATALGLGDVQLQTNYAHALELLGDVDPARNIYKKVLDRNPGERNAAINLAISYMRTKDWSEGLKLYEKRLTVAEQLQHKRLKSLIETTSNLEHTSIKVEHEQGYGDALFLHSTVERLALCTKASVYMELPAALLPLFKQKIGSGSIRYVAQKTNIKTDFTVQLMSVPYVFDAFDGFPRNTSPVKNTTERNMQGGVGLCWRGNAEHNFSLQRDVDLKIILKNLCAKTKYTALAYKLTNLERDLIELFPNIDVNFQPTDFAQLYDKVSSLSRVVTVDTAVAHLAGCVGTETVMMVREPIDWRWGNDLSAPFYPNLSFIRMDGHDLVTELREALTLTCA